MQKHTRINEELAPVKGGIRDGPVIARHKSALLNHAITTERQAHLLDSMLRTDKIIKVAVMPFFHRQLGRRDGQAVERYESAVASLICDNTFVVLLPAKNQLAEMQSALGEQGVRFSPNKPIIYSYEGSLLVQSQQPAVSGEIAKAVQNMLFGDGLKLIKGNDAAIEAFRAEFARKEVEGAFVFGIGPGAGPVANAMQSIKAIRGETKVTIKCEPETEGGEPRIVQFDKRAFVTFNPIAAKEITEL